MPLVLVDDLGIRFRGPSLLDSVSCSIEHGERIGLLGRNGSGKTTFMKILSGQVSPDHGRVLWSADSVVSFLPQEVPTDLAGPVDAIVAQGLQLRPEDPAWLKEQKLHRTIEQMSLPAEAQFESLSAGLKRRVLLARAIVSEPDMLLLDEPTNHLDVPSIMWLEDFLARWPHALLFVTHDRSFLRRLASRIIELDRGRLFDWTCDYDTFLTRKEAALAAEEKQQALFDKKLAEEEVWIRQGIKARRTRNEGRVRALEAMRVERSQRREKVGNVSLSIQEAERSGALVADVKEISFAYPDRPIVSDFSMRIMRGDKIGVLGPNGAGKTTLLRLLLGELAPQSGKVKLGTNLQVLYFDQLRGKLREDATVFDEVGDGNDRVQIGNSSKHVIGYLKDFLFTAERARTQIKYLSGGERNRVLLAKLFTKPANVIVLDEPTNDLDAETLEILEDRLVQFTGTVLVVSHDRTFLNNVVSSTLVFEDDNVREYDGGYDDWLRQRSAQERNKKEERSKTEDRSKKGAGAERDKSDSSTKANKNGTGSEAAKASRKGLSFKEQQELGSLPATIDQLETQIGQKHELMASPDFYKQSGDAIAAQQSELAALELRLTKAYARWEELEAKNR